jgi:hypothetical protein
MLLAIDPGVDQGWALFSDSKTLLGCGLGAPPSDPVSRIIIERPHGHGNKAPIRDIITLAIRAGETGGVLREFRGVTPEYIEPATWKGSVKKKISHERIWAKLSTLEQDVVARAGGGIAASKRHNMLDAVGIGLFGVGR